MKYETDYYRNLFKEGKTLSEIVDITGDGYIEIHKAIKDLKGGRFTYKDVSQEHKDDMAQMYRDGISSVVIGKKYGVSHKFVGRILDTYGIERIGNGRRTYKVNEHYFDEIDTPEKAYILGFLDADGCNFMPKQTISMSLQEGDRPILERICKEMDNEHPLEFIDYSNKHDFGYTYQNQYRMLIFSTYMCRQLQSLGMVPRKSYCLEYPAWLRKDLHSHFIRGYFDGNGTMTHGHYLSIVSTKAFCEGFIDYFTQNFSDIKYNIRNAKKGNDFTGVINFSGKNATYIAHWMYSDATIYLQRKYDKYLSSFVDKIA